ncbi:hypothetical protein HOE04_02915 [archaeon]|jgi:uncharacterized membrane protein|nr:hypothetical protein [archaeon]
MAKKPAGAPIKGKKKIKLNNDDRNLFAFLASFFTIVGFIIALILWKEDKYVMYYAKHGLVLFIGQVVLAVLTPFLFFLIPILWVFWIVLWVLVWISALSGKRQKVFIVSDLAKKIKL